MKSFLICLILLSTYCCCERLLGGWSALEDDSLKSECLDKALTHIHGAPANDEIRSEASNLNCQSQLVNGLNIKCSFVTRGEKWQCSYYKSFVQVLETQLEKCDKQKDEPDKEEKVDDDKQGSNEGANEDEEEQQQPLIENENEEAEEQPVTVSSGEKEKQGAQETAVDNEKEEEEDDEAAVDAMNKQVSGQFSNNDAEQKKK
jgi:hypothetical protein